MRRRRTSPRVATPDPQPTRVTSPPTNSPAHGLCEPISHRGLRWFRTLFLLALVYDSWCMATRGEMADFFGRPAGLNFVYPAAPWVRPLPAPLMEWMPHAIGGAALVALVFPCCGLAAATGLQAYLFLCDAARYVNHHYLYILLSALLLLTPPGASAQQQTVCATGFIMDTFCTATVSKALNTRPTHMHSERRRAQASHAHHTLNTHAHSPTQRAVPS